MRPWHAIALTTAALGAGYALGAASASRPADVAAEIDTLRTERDAAAARAERAEGELAAARDVRRKPRNGSAEATGDPAASPSAVPGPGVAADAARTEPSGPERLASLKSRLQKALADGVQARATKDGERLLGLLRELAALGRDLPDARDAAMTLALEINKDVNGAGELRLPMQAFYGGLGDPAIRDLMVWSLENQATSSADFRDLSVWSLPWVATPDETIARFDAALAHEPDRTVETDIVRNLAGINSPKAEALLLKVLGESTRDASVRAEAAMGLSTSKDPAAHRAIDLAAGAEADSRFQAAHRISTIVRDPPASGVLVLTTTPEGAAAAAGIGLGDLIVSYNGKAVPTDGDLRREQTAASSTAASGAETVPVVVLRDGQERTIQVKPGRLGVSLRAVAKK